MKQKSDKTAVVGLAFERPNRSFVAAIAVKYGQRLRRFLSGKVRDAADVPDLAQEVFLRLMRVADHSAIRCPEAYLFTVASHVLHEHAVRRSGRPVMVEIGEFVGSEVEAGGGSSAEFGGSVGASHGGAGVGYGSESALVSGDDPVARAETLERVEELQRALAQLPPRVSATLVLHRLAGFSIEEIGRQLGVARPTAKKYLARALTHCRNTRLAE